MLSGQKDDKVVIKAANIIAKKGTVPDSKYSDYII